MKIEISIPNLKRAVAALNRAPQIVGPRLNNAIKSSIYDIQRQTLPRVPIDTGHLRNSLVTGVVFRPLYGSIGSNLKYSIYVHEGTRPHLINSPVFIKRVGWRFIKMHPGTKAKPFLREGVQASTSNISGYFKDQINLALKEIAKEGS